ncbi:MAG: 3-dehydroquinate synthase [Bacteriovoracaceae bacterium]|nr:3-dehydroquinate synthase [Bacteriovoracaceae bacterium]
MANISLVGLKQELADEKFFIVDEKLVDLYTSELDFLKDKHVLTLKDPESHKSMASFEKCLNFFLAAQITRSDRIVAIGGGALSDLAGFVASTILRGIDWIVVPTTLLSIIDASIGGKTGINSKYGKNLIGAFHMPVKSFVCLEFLNTLPKIEQDSGRGELTKYAFLDKSVYAALKENDLDRTIDLCRRCKEEIVEKDFKEGGERAKLNLGHTFGHAVEKITGIPHGIAVAIGLEMVLDLYSDHLRDELVWMKSTLELDYELPQKLNAQKFWELLFMDKKRKGDELMFIIPKEIGDVEYRYLNLEQLKQGLSSHDKYKSFFA